MYTCNLYIINSFSEYLLRAYSVLCTIKSAWDDSVKTTKKGKTWTFVELTL